MASVIRGSGTSSLGGDLDIEGVLTYEDVASVDSVGVITARSGIEVTGHTETDTLNVSGISTAGSLVVDGNVSSTTQFSGFDGLRIHNNNGSAFGVTADMYFTAGTSTNNRGAAIGVEYNSSTSGNDLYFATNGSSVTSNDTLSERLRITSSGKVLTSINQNSFNHLDFGNQSAFHAYGNSPVIAAEGNSSGYTEGAFLTINSSTSAATTRGGGLFMYSSGDDKEWFIGRPYAGSDGNDAFVVARATSVSQPAQATATSTNSLFTINSSSAIHYTQPANYFNSAQTYLRTFGFTFNLQNLETEILFYNPDGYRRIYYEMYVSSAHGSNGRGYLQFNMSRYGIDYEAQHWSVADTTYSTATSVGGNVNNTGIQFTRSGAYSGTEITYYAIVKAYSPSGGSPFSISGLTDATYRYYNQGF